MNRNVILAVVAVAIAVVVFPLVLGLLRKNQTDAPSVVPSVTTPLHEAARDGKLASVQQLLREGANPNAVDEQGKTPLHWAASNGHMQTTKALLDGKADPGVRDAAGKTPLDYARAGGHDGTARELMAAAGHVPGGEVAPVHPVSESAGLTVVETGKQTLNPSLKYPDLPAFERAIGQSGCLLTSEHIWFFAPKTREEAAGIVFPYLVQAYQMLHGIVGVDTEYIIVVYNFPKGSKEAFGGTSNCVIYYDDTNLRLDQQEEWTQYAVPHVSGYIEEMAHNFVAATKAQFGWEMVGWSIGVKASQAVASNPIFLRSLSATHQTQADTYQRYVAMGFVLPPDVPPNLVDRIHAHLLTVCEQRYGPTFWPDFFAEIRKEAGPLRDAVHASGDDAIRDTRYRITIECFDRLPGLNFKQLLRDSGLSLTTDVKSLHPTNPGWNRRLM